MATPSSKDLALVVEVQGNTYTLRLADFTGEDDLDCYRKTGFSVTDIFVNSVITLFTLAALVWLHRRKNEPQLKFEDVNKQITFDVMETVRDEGAEEGDDTGPPA